MPRSSFRAPSTLRAHIPKLLSEGVCLVFPGLTMPAPIPLNECIVLVSGRLLWGTFHTPYGNAQPCVGQIEFAKWRVKIPQDGTYELLDARKQVVVSLVPLSALPLTLNRANRLRRVQSRHQIRAAANASYARRWARKFREVNNAHLSME